MKEFIEKTDMSKGKKIAISLGMLFCTVTFSASSVFSFYSNMPKLGASFLAVAELSLISGSCMFGGSFWQKPVFGDTEQTPLIVDKKDSSIINGDISKEVVNDETDHVINFK